METKQTNMNTVICSAFCGVGKSYLCEKYPNKYIEFECWKYQDGDFPNNYIKDILDKFGKVEYIFISTNPVVSRRLNELGYDINLFYPKNELKEEYFNRYTDRGSHEDFLITLDKHWDEWIDELKEQDYCNQIVLNKGEYLQDVI